MIPLLSVVALLEDIADRGLWRGRVGTVVERLAPGVYEVEFSDGDGRTYATLPLCADQLLQLRHEPSRPLNPLSFAPHPDFVYDMN